MKFSNEKNKGWTLILISAVCEIIWAICIDFTQGLRVMTWNAVVVLFLAISVVLLSMSIRPASILAPPTQSGRASGS